MFLAQILKNGTPINIGRGIHDFNIESKEINLSYDNNLKDGVDEMIKGFSKARLSKRISTVAEAAQTLLSSNQDENNIQLEGAYISKYKNLLYWESSSPIKMDDISLVFNYGWLDLFDNKEEVWNPIVDLLAEFAPKDNGSKLKGPAPTSPVLAVQLAKAVAKNKVKDLQLLNPSTKDKKTVDTSSDIVNQVTKLLALQDSIYNAFDTAVKENLDSDFALYQLKLGAFISPSFYVENVKSTFDWTQVDSNGFPAKGTLTISGWSTPEMATKQAFSKNSLFPETSED